MRTWLLCGMLVAGISALSGCSFLEDLGGAMSNNAPPASAGAPPEAAPNGGSEPSAASTSPPLATTPVPKRKPDIVDPKTLVGLDKAAVTALFGEPHSITLAQPALVWSWRTDDCVLRLFFYPDVSDRKFKALAYQINTTEEKHKAVVIDTCATRLKWAHDEATR